MFDWLPQDWHHCVPFAALLSRERPIENRPAMTRILEQSFVGIVAAGLGSFVMIQVQAAEINTIKLQMVKDEQRSAKAVEDSEARLTAQITELRAIMLKKN